MAADWGRMGATIKQLPFRATLFIGGLTPGRQRCSVKKKEMRDAIPPREKNWRATAVSLLTLLALLVAPVCAPFCGGQACLQAQTAMASETHCHAEMAADNNSSQMHATLNCNSSELPVAALSTGNKRDIPQASRPRSQVASMHAVSQEFASILAENCMSRSTNTESLPSSTSFLAMGVLRI